jgi:hypothetical protein
MVRSLLANSELGYIFPTCSSDHVGLNHLTVPIAIKASFGRGRFISSPRRARIA